MGDEEASGLGLALVFGDAGLFAGSGWSWTFVLIKKISALYALILLKFVSQPNVLGSDSLKTFLRELLNIAQEKESQLSILFTLQSISETIFSSESRSNKGPVEFSFTNDNVPPTGASCNWKAALSPSP